MMSFFVACRYHTRPHSTIARVQPTWIDESHFNEARQSLLAHLFDGDVDSVDQLFPGTSYKLQYGGYSVNEMIAPHLKTFQYSVPKDENRLLGMCFSMDRKFVLRCLPSPPSPESLVETAMNTIRLTGDDEEGSMLGFAATNIAGGSVICQVTRSPDCAIMLSVGDDNLKLPDAAKFTAAPNCSLGVGSFETWAQVESERYLIEASEKSNVTMIGDTQVEYLVTTRDIAAGEKFSCAYGLLSQMLENLGAMDVSKVQPDVWSSLEKVHSKFVQHERRVLGMTGACERARVPVGPLTRL
jgi:hypothetical protein